MRWALCTLLLGGCSLTFIHSVPEATAYSTPSECEDRYLLPFVDGAVGALAVLGTAFYAHNTHEQPDPCGPHPDNNCDIFPLPSGRHVVMAAGVVTAGVYLVSSLIGGQRVATCREQPEALREAYAQRVEDEKRWALAQTRATRMAQIRLDETRMFDDAVRAARANDCAAVKTLEKQVRDQPHVDGEPLGGFHDRVFMQNPDIKRCWDAEVLEVRRVTWDNYQRAQAAARWNDCKTVEALEQQIIDAANADPKSQEVHDAVFAKDPDIALCMTRALLDPASTVDAKPDPIETTKANERHWFEEARVAARAQDCAAVKVREKQVRELPEVDRDIPGGFHDGIFLHDPEINRCLHEAAPASNMGP